jgi:hypothetical protein
VRSGASGGVAIDVYAGADKERELAQIETSPSAVVTEWLIELESVAG